MSAPSPAGKPRSTGIPEAERAALRARLDRFLDAHYRPGTRKRVRLTFRGAVASLELANPGAGHGKIGILRWTGDPNAWGYGHWMKSKYSRFWIGGRGQMPPEWGLALGLYYAGKVAPQALKANNPSVSSSDIEPWVIALALPVAEQG